MFLLNLNKQQKINKILFLTFGKKMSFRKRFASFLSSSFDLLVDIYRQILIKQITINYSEISVIFQIFDQYTWKHNFFISRFAHKTKKLHDAKDFLLIFPINLRVCLTLLRPGKCCYFTLNVWDILCISNFMRLYLLNYSK